MKPPTGGNPRGACASRKVKPCGATPGRSVRLQTADCGNAVGGLHADVLGHALGAPSRANAVSSITNFDSPRVTSALMWSLLESTPTSRRAAVGRALHSWTVGRCIAPSRQPCRPALGMPFSIAYHFSKSFDKGKVPMRPSLALDLKRSVIRRRGKPLSHGEPARLRLGAPRHRQGLQRPRPACRSVAWRDVVRPRRHARGAGIAARRPLRSVDAGRPAAEDSDKGTRGGTAGMSENRLS